MRYLSLCSGIEAASVAWKPLGWEPVAFSEIEPFPYAVLSHHYPTVPNWGDMTKFEEWSDATVDVLVGGTPCQSFSVAGLRNGLDDPRGNLMLVFGAIAERYRPTWLVWENVPGVLSSNGGRDFGTFLGMLGQLGYGFAYRVLDAQFTRVSGFPRAVPQRRRRVFLVGCLGDWRPPAAVLFERESLSGHSPPSRKARKEITEVAGTLAANGGGLNRPAGNANELDFCGATGIEFGPSGGRFTDVNPTLDARAKDGPIRNQLAGAVLCEQPYSVANCLTQRMHKGINSTLDEGQTPIVSFEANMSQQSATIGNGAYPTITRRTHAAVAFPINTQIATRCEALGEKIGMGIGEDGAPDFTLQTAHHHAVAFTQNQAADVLCGDVMHSLGTNQNATGWNAPNVMTAMTVRRLTPRECERLMGFPDDYTFVPYRGKPAADGNRYKALGNSMAVNCMRWIGERIELVEGML